MKSSGVNPAAGKQKWNSYLEPINQLLDAIDQKQIDLKQASRAVTQFGVQWYTQAKLLGGLRNLYDGIKTKAIASINDGATGGFSSYLTTFDGALMKSATDALDPAFTARDTLTLIRITADGKIAQDLAFLFSDTIGSAFAQNNYLIQNLHHYVIHNC